MEQQKVARPDVTEAKALRLRRDGVGYRSAEVRRREESWRDLRLQKGVCRSAFDNTLYLAVFWRLFY